MLNAILWDFHQGRNYSRRMWDVRNPSNKKAAATTTQPAQKQEKTWEKQSQPNASCWKEDGRNRGKNERLGHFGGTSRKEPCWMPFCGISTREEIILGVCEMSGTPRIKKQLPQPPNQHRNRTKHEKNNHNQMLLAEKKMEEIEGNMKGWDILGALPGKSHVECHSVGFPPGKKLF